MAEEVKERPNWNDSIYPQLRLLDVYKQNTSHLNYAKSYNYDTSYVVYDGSRKNVVLAIFGTSCFESVITTTSIVEYNDYSRDNFYIDVIINSDWTRLGEKKLRKYVNNLRIFGKLKLRKFKNFRYPQRAVIAGPTRKEMSNLIEKSPNSSMFKLHNIGFDKNKKTKVVYGAGDVRIRKEHDIFIVTLKYSDYSSMEHMKFVLYNLRYVWEYNAYKIVKKQLQIMKKNKNFPKIASFFNAASVITPITEVGHSYRISNVCADDDEFFKIIEENSYDKVEYRNNIMGLLGKSLRPHLMYLTSNRFASTGFNVDTRQQFIIDPSDFKTVEEYRKALVADIEKDKEKVLKSARLFIDYVKVMNAEVNKIEINKN